MGHKSEIVSGAVKRNTKIAEGVYELVIGSSACAAYIPGQFVNIYLDDKSMLLPRPISICDAGSGNITLVYKVAGKGTGYLSEYSEKRPIKFSTPLGNGYCINEDYSGRHIALVAGGIGIPPMIGLAKTLNERNANVNVFLGYQSEVFLAHKLKEFSGKVSISTDDGNFGYRGNVVDMLKGSSIYDEYFACGPKGMLKALSGYAKNIDREIQVSVEERMGCGYGACFGCSCKISDEGESVRKLVCKDGPVFWGRDLLWE